ncbi:MAG: hypothetical protein WBF88_15620 [Pusillimonas sp.]
MNNPGRLLANSSCMALICYLIYEISGVLLGTFRTDEVYFLANSLAPLKEYPYHIGKPPIFEWLLTGFWRVIDGDTERIWMLRLVSWIFVVTQGWLVYRILRLLSRDLPAHWSRFVIEWLFVACYLVIMAAYRAYEVRPEIIANTLLLACSYIALLQAKPSPARWESSIPVLVAGIGLVAMASLSYRYTIPGTILAIFLLKAAWRNGGQSLLTVCIVIWLSFALYLNLFLYDVFSSIQEAASFQSSRTPLTVQEKLFLGGTIHVYAKWALLFALFILMWGFLRKARLSAVSSASPLAPILCLVGYYFFFFVFDVRPYAYVLSIEFLLIFLCTSFYLNWSHSQSRPGTTLRKCLAFLFTVFTLISVIEAIVNLNILRNPTLTIRGFINSAGSDDISNATDVALVRLMVSPYSVLNQSRARHEYCRRYPEGTALVHTYMLHPICMRDGGSRALAGWGGSIDLFAMDLAQFQYISFSNAQIAKMENLEDGFWRIGVVFTRKNFHE